MGADIWIYTKKEPNFDGIDSKIVEKEPNGSYYYRDSYNVTNLAWVIDLSYLKSFEKSPTKFLKKLTKITDEQIEKAVRENIKNELDYMLGREYTEEEIQEIIHFLKTKREYLKRLIEAGIRKIEYSI